MHSRLFEKRIGSSRRGSARQEPRTTGWFSLCEMGQELKIPRLRVGLVFVSFEKCGPKGRGWTDIDRISGRSWRTPRQDLSHSLDLGRAGMVAANASHGAMKLPAAGRFENYLCVVRTYPPGRQDFDPVPIAALQGPQTLHSLDSARCAATGQNAIEPQVDQLPNR